MLAYNAEVKTKPLLKSALKSKIRIVQHVLEISNNNPSDHLELNPQTNIISF